ncbi:uncharacterized protein [Cicer arietinum]|uniref:Uncharacterized protein LOC101494013 n=1 Tax=Cicer arietinum TaxID=3827 RepID=A0A1S2YVQ7_CICAR|nr:uncharacterized protein LOC101494013 [Cicer arietinum]
MDRRCGNQIFKSILKCSCSDSDSMSHDDAKKNMNQNSDSTQSCNVISKLLLPKDLMFDIFSFIPLNCLLKYARYVCKSWAAIISSSEFAEVYELHRARFKPGLYVENCIEQSSSYFMDINGVNGQFEMIDFGTPSKMGNVISTCDGILLLTNICRQIIIANPILKCWLRIPPIPNSQKPVVISLQCTIARVPRTGKFKLFFIDILEVSGADWYVFYVLRIGIDNSWKEIARKEAPDEWCFLWKPLYSGDNDLYWITFDEVIVMDVDKEIIIRECPLPFTSMFSGPLSMLLWMGNRLSCIKNKGFSTTYQIFILDFDTGNWSLYHEMGPFDYAAACGRELKIMTVEFRLWIDDQIIFQVALCETGKRINFSYNIKTRQLTKIEGIAEGYFEVWLHTNSLVSLPSTPT